MKWIKRKIVKWCKEAWDEARKANEVTDLRPVALQMDEISGPPPKTRFAVMSAINGKFIEIATYKPNPRGSDWETEYFIVPEGKKVSEALTMLLLLKGTDE